MENTKNNTNRVWKQPVPTDINYDNNFNFLDRAIFREILCYCQNERYVSSFIHAKRNYEVELQQGQCILKVSKIANVLAIDPKRIRKSIEKLSKWYSELESRAMPYGLIITVKNYDKLICMERKWESRRRVEGEKKESRRRPNIECKESDKSDKTLLSQKIATAEEAIKYFNKSKQRHIKIIGLYFLQDRPPEISYEIIRSFIQRNLRPAKVLTAYSLSRIKEVMRWLRVNADFKWTLESVGKYIDQDLDKITIKK